jgi:hypothetical protein
MYYSSETQKSSSSAPLFLRHLRWMMAKDLMKLDMLLVDPPEAGECYRRRWALSYADMTQTPIDVLTISGDASTTTTIQFVDQAPIRAAKYERRLLLDSLEKAERNVFPTLHNFLKNREMYLEDGSLLMPPVASMSSPGQRHIPHHLGFQISRIFESLLWGYPTTRHSFSEQCSKRHRQQGSTIGDGPCVQRDY